MSFSEENPRYSGSTLGNTSPPLPAMKDEEKAITPEPEWKPTIHELAIMLTMSITSLMIALDATIVVTTIGTIISDLQGTATEGFWIGTSYLLTCAVCMPFIASLSDIFGRAPCLLASLATFTLGTILCCVAENLATLIAGRCVQGIGGSGGLIILGLVIFTDIVPLRFRSKYYGIIQGAWAIGTCVGPVVGGAFVANTTWRWIFYIMFPFIGIAFATIPFVLTLKPRTESLGTKLARVDWLGGFLFISSSTSFLIAISWGGSQQPWDSFRTLVPLILGALGLVATGIFEAKFAKEPFFGRNIFHCFSAFAAYLGTTLQGFLLYGLLYYGVLYFSAVQGYGPVRTGTSALPATVALVPASIIVGVLITRFGRFRWAVWSGWVVTTLGHGLMIMWDENTSTPAWAAILVIVGVGHGLILNAQNFATQAIALPGDEAQAAAMYAFLRSFGMALGVGVGGSVFQNVMMIRLDDYGLPDTIARNAETYIHLVWSQPRTAESDQIIDSFVYGFRGVYGLLCAIAGVGLLSSFFIQKFNLDKELVTEHTLAENNVTRKLQRLSHASQPRTSVSRPESMVTSDSAHSSRPVSSAGPTALSEHPHRVSEPSPSRLSIPA